MERTARRIYTWARRTKKISSTPYPVVTSRDFSRPLVSVLILSERPRSRFVPHSAIRHRRRRQDPGGWQPAAAQGDEGHEPDVEGRICRQQRRPPTSSSSPAARRTPWAHQRSCMPQPLGQRPQRARRQLWRSVVHAAVRQEGTERCCSQRRRQVDLFFLMVILAKGLHSVQPNNS
ncbi:unnamed protein product [Urochloa humidicola]